MKKEIDKKKEELPAIEDYDIFLLERDLKLLGAKNEALASRIAQVTKEKIKMRKSPRKS